MIIYPAIDLHQGNCVRLQQGGLDSEIVFSSDPLKTARHWESLGADWLHVVNLDGAFASGGQANLEALERILADTTVPVQFGGGLRSLADIRKVLDLGVARVVLGTVALRKPDLVKEALDAWGAERVSVGIDARGGSVAVQGWTQVTAMKAAEFALMLKQNGLERIIYTDIERDGMLSGINIEMTTTLAAATGLRIIASGGAAGLEDIRELMQVENQGIEGVIIGMALYRGAIDLQEALRITRGEGDAG
ncbi:MAG: 1-(5-phosphoribosyl)-5-[(5-phosphoribosylamino)methylideneamino]imidazole-4-carboxamide isomerase [Chloroflexi bacterium]|nr:1-(5-phosphoribosyl)-5-[(5-phosphoribosylamino)methylideneamino]imidazole-4-carboxamide isomerase [Chloroflexota bacterium]